ncbi:MAG: Rossmann-like and DUF2520 domain-containing protein [Actinomycetota bacterium]
MIFGRGRAGTSFAAALAEVGWSIELVSSHSLDASARLTDAELVLLTVSDAAIGDVADRLAERHRSLTAVVAHVSGACDLDVLAAHPRVGSIHPLMSLPDAETGARRLLDRCTFAIDGDPLIDAVVADLGGRAIRVTGSRRALYHATASVAANHLTALCAQVERLAASVDVPVDAYWTMMRTTLENVEERGPGAALTGPAARADWPTIRSHLAALPSDEQRLYLVLCEGAATLAGHDLPDDLAAQLDGAPSTPTEPRFTTGSVATNASDSSKDRHT